MIRFALICCFVLSAVIAPAQSQQHLQKEPKPSQPQQQATPDERGTDKMPLSVKIISPTKTKAETDQDTKERAEKSAVDHSLVKYTRLLGVVAALQFIAMLVQAVVLGIQAHRLRQTVDQMRDTERQQLRAFVSITPWMLSNFGAVHRIQIEFATRNHGQTPAFDINYIFDMAVLPTPLPNNFVFPAPTQLLNPNSSLFPHARMKTWFNNNRILTTAEVASVHAGIQRFHVWGRMTYIDIYGRPCHTDINASAGGPTLGRVGVGFHWEYGQGHNRAT
jgi:hypothetical protein